MSKTSATTSLNRFQNNDNIFVNIGRTSHPAIFLEYCNEDSQARVRYASSSTTSIVELSQLELMDTTTKRRRTPKPNTTHDATDSKTTQKRCAKPGTVK